jgi:hypothetical protein
MEEFKSSFGKSFKKGFNKTFSKKEFDKGWGKVVKGLNTVSAALTPKIKVRSRLEEYDLKGCYNTYAGSPLLTSLGKYEQYYTKPELCLQRVKKRGKNAFMITNGGACYSFSNRDIEKIHKYPKISGGTCKTGVGGPGHGLIYQRVPPPPQLSESNFPDNTIYNPNTNLYDHIFSGLYREPDMKRAENSNFNDMKAYKTTTKTGEGDCSNSCNNDTYCTSYKYNINSDDSNCVLYNKFPTEIINNKPNANVGYKTNYSVNFDKLNGNAKTRIQKEVANKYINGYFNTNLDYNSCLSIDNDSSKQPGVLRSIGLKKSRVTEKTNINLDPQCVYNMYNNIDRGSEKFIPKYTNNSKINEKSDSNNRLDDYYKLRKDQTNAKSNIVKLNSKNDGLSQSQIRLNNKQKINLKNSAEAINNRQSMFYEDISNSIGTSNEIVEQFSNHESNSQIKFFLFMIIILSILFIIFYCCKKMKK